MNQFKTPLLFIVFNRPETTKIVFDEIKKLKPNKLFIAADGPRPGNENDRIRCIEVRRITKNIDWKCDVERLYRNKNMGCGAAVSSAINWFFEKVDKGIILEDDCLPDKSFFTFAEEMLEKYKDNPKVMQITGDNFIRNSGNNKDHYMMSSYPHIWGWATWKRAWRKYDFNMKIWNQKNIYQKVTGIKKGFWSKIYWTALFDGASHRVIDTWDYQWVYTVISNQGLSIFPGVNLISNIGFGKNSSHTKDDGYSLSNLARFSISKSPKIDKSKSVYIIDDYEEKNIFKVKSLKTLILFLYYSVFYTIKINEN